MARQHSFILPSGVKMTVRELTGKDQGTITKEGSAGDPSTFNQMLSDCSITLGDKSNVIKTDIENMLSNDRKYALVELRQFSLRYKEEFNFSYEWPIKGGKKETHDYSVIFTRDSFTFDPYKWVKNHMDKMSDEEKELMSDHYPEMYDSYSDMLSENLEQDYETEDGLLIKWNCSTGKQEEKFNGVSKSLRDINLPIRMREPKEMRAKSDGSGVVPMKWNFDDEGIYEVEKFRKTMRETEGYIDTYLTIEHQEDPSKQARVDLVATIDFFFPSQAI